MRNFEQILKFFGHNISSKVQWEIFVVMWADSSYFSFQAKYYQINVFILQSHVSSGREVFFFLFFFLLSFL